MIEVSSITRAIELFRPSIIRFPHLAASPWLFQGLGLLLFFVWTILHAWLGSDLRVSAQTLDSGFPLARPDLEGLRKQVCYRWFELELERSPARRLDEFGAGMTCVVFGVVSKPLLWRLVDLTWSRSRFAFSASLVSALRRRCTRIWPCGE